MHFARQLIASVLASLCLTGPAVADAVYPAEISASETETIDGMAKRTFDSFRAGKTAAGLNQFFGNGDLMKGKGSEMAYLASQIDSLPSVYGAMGECRLAEQRMKAGLLVQRLYLCRHGQYMTRWKMMFVNTSNGWAGVNLSFDDKVWLSLDD